MYRIESLLSARLFLNPQLVGERIFFISNLSGHMSLYRMDWGGSVPEPLIPPQISLQNPILMNGLSFKVYPHLDQVLVLIDQDGDEVYQPTLVPISGGYPQPLFSDVFADHQVNLIDTDQENNIAYFWASSQVDPINRAFRADLGTGEIIKLAESMYGGFPVGHNKNHTKFIVLDAYGAGDHVVSLVETDQEPKLLYGVPLDQRKPGQIVPPNSISECYFIQDDQALLFHNSIFSDTYGIGYMDLSNPTEPSRVEVRGEEHIGMGELESLHHLTGNQYLLQYNIDGSTWVYEGGFDPEHKTITLEHTLVGKDQLSGGVLKGLSYDKADDRFAFSFTTATSPTQIFTISGSERDTLTQHTRERVLGIPEKLLAPGEDASFTSFDGLEISARLYLPDPSLEFDGPRPLVYYIHGGPQSQEHPDFAWFSMPLIQILTLRGFAVFVPNVRGSTGYGFKYMKHVEKDWGGADRLDHVHAITEVLPYDHRLDTLRSAVVGRSYGGYMTLTLAGRHPELWKAACDMFGPYDLGTFAERVPETWKPLIEFMIGNPETEADFLRERSPKTYLNNLQCPMLVIQGKNDPRVIEKESRELVEELREQGKDMEYLMFENEGHDVLKFENRVRCYDAIVDIFVKHLQP